MSAASAILTSADEPSFDAPSSPPSAPLDPPELEDPPLLLAPELLLPPELLFPPELELLLPAPELLAPLLDEVLPLPELLLLLPLPELLPVPPLSVPGSAGVPLEQPGARSTAHTANADAVVAATEK